MSMSDGPGAQERVRGRLKSQFTRPVQGSVAIELGWTYALLVACLGAALVWPAVWVWALAFAGIVCVQTRMAVLMHEGAHWLLHSEKARNDRVANLLTAFPILMTVQAYRANHLPHHTRLGTPDDPDYRNLCLPPMRRGLLFSLAGALFGMRHLQLLQKYTGEPDRSVGGLDLSGLAGRLLWQIALLGVCVAAGWPAAYFVLWLLPLLTASVLINELRSILEHTQLPDALGAHEARALAPVSRTVRPGWMGRACLGPISFCYHHEHHLFPSVPFARLRELHEELCAEGYYDDHPDLVWDGYGSLLRRLWSAYGLRGVRLEIREVEGSYVAERI